MVQDQDRRSTGDCYDAEEAIQRIDQAIRWLGKNIRRMESKELNLGYPVLICIFAQIDYLSSIIYRSERSGRKRVGKYFNEFMASVDPRYRLIFKNRHVSLDGRTTLKNLGELMYVAVRCKLVHESNVFPPFSVATKFDKHVKGEHLRPVEGGKHILLMAYEINRHFVDSVVQLKNRLRRDKGFLSTISKSLEAGDADLDCFSRRAEHACGVIACGEGESSESV